MASLSYRVAAEAERIGDKLVQEFFPQIAESGVRIDYLFRSEASKSGGKICLGKCRKIGGLNAILAMDGGPSEDAVQPKDVAFLVIEIAEDYWSRMEQAQRTALVHHELLHVLVEPGEEEADTWTIRLRAHDLEAFADEVRIYGLWKPDLTFFAQSTDGAMALPFPESDQR